MNSLHAIRLSKRILPPKAYQALKRYYELGSPRRLFLSLPYGLIPRYQYPSMLSISLTTRCNLRCFICRREGFRGEDLKFENIYKLEKAIKYAREISLTGWGESLLHPRFEDILNYIYSVNSKKDLIQLTTNGTLLSERTAKLLAGHLKTLTISLNAATEKTYNRDMKNGDFQETLSAIQDFLLALEKKDQDRIRLHFVAHKQNFRELPDFVLMAKKLGVPVVSIGHYLVGSLGHSQYNLLHVKDEYSKIVNQTIATGKKLGVSVNISRHFLLEKERSTKECLSPYTECIVEVNGDVMPCCFCGTFRMGNVYEKSFEDVWFSEKYRILRKDLNLQGCSNCSNFVPLDSFDAHFTSCFKETDEFERAEREFWVPDKSRS